MPVLPASTAFQNPTLLRLELLGGQCTEYMKGR